MTNTENSHAMAPILWLWFASSAQPQDIAMEEEEDFDLRMKYHMQIHRQTFDPPGSLYNRAATVKYSESCVKN